MVNFEVVFIRKNLFSCNVPLMTYYLSVMLVVYSEKVACWSEKGNDDALLLIFTIQYPVPLFSLCTKSLIAVLKDAKQLSEENGGGPFC